MQRHVGWSWVFGALVCLPLFADLPKVQFSANASFSEISRAETYRDNLVRTLEFWQRAGLKKPLAVDSITVISSYDGLHLLDLLKLLNPDVPNVQAHIEEQHRHFLRSELAGKIRKLEEDNKLPSGVLTKAFFDQYAGIRYGYSFSNFYEEVVRNPLVSSLYADANDKMPSDNAYYGRYPQVDLTKHLPLRDPDGKISLAFMSLIASSPDTISLYEHLARSKVGMSRRIVILPRLGQLPGDLDISLLNDFMVGSHELGHHINASLGDVPRLVDEAMADFIAAMVANDPKVGAFFATSSKEVARRIRARGGVTPRVERTLRHLEELAEKGFLRNLEEFWSIDHLTRDTRFADNYEAGNPIRTFLWNLRKEKGVETVALGAIEELANQPVLISPNTTVQLNLRRLGLEISRRKQIAREAARQELEGEGKLSPEATVDLLLAEKEAALLEMRLDKVKKGEAFTRPVIHADYILSEYFRAFASAAQKVGHAGMLEAVREQAGRVMNAHCEYVASSSGHKTLVFFKKRVQTTQRPTRQRIEQLLNLREGATMLLGDSRFVGRALETYAFSVSAIQEFERFGDATYLTNPWPNIAKARERLDHLQNCGEALASNSPGDEEEVILPR